MTRTVDKTATRVARARHTAGQMVLDFIFNGNDMRAAREQLAYQRIFGGQSRSATKKHWTRPQRRTRAKAQRIARRKNR